MTKEQKQSLRNGIVSAVIGAAVSLLIAGVTLAATFGSITEQVQQIGKDVDRLVTSVDSMQRQNSTMCERIASLEAQVRLYQTGKGGSP